MNRQRRTPPVSYTEMNQAPPTPIEGKGIAVNDFAPSASLRQSPPPVNNLLIPTGAIISPPDSSENSDGDEGQESIRGRALEIRKLQDAVREIDVKREPSPETVFHASSSAPVSETVSPTALTASARKISHSRSATETAILSRSTSFGESPANTSDDSDEDNLGCKPALVRKKSGELVKPALRPSSRRRYSSMPGTPTYSKSVHFNDNDNQTRHFLQVDKPIAVSAGSSPVEVYESESEYPFDETSKVKSQRDIKLANFPEESFERKTQPVRVERIFLSSDKQTLIGTCAVQNIAFHKLVVARFTLDYWKTTSEVVAEYHSDPRNPSTDDCDRFNFHIKLSDAANIDDKTLLLCVRYAVNGTEYWDNNKDMNYQIDFIKSVKKTPKIKILATRDSRPHNAIPRSKHSPPESARGRRENADDEFAATFNNNSSYHFGTPDFIAESPSTIKLKPKTKQSHPAVQGTSKNLGGRYDFGASLSAALTHAQEKLGRHSGLLGNHEMKSTGSYFGPQERKEGPTTSNNDKPNLGLDRPAMGSDQYRDLVQKFCYFTPASGSGKSITSPTGTAAAPKVAVKAHEQADIAVTPSKTSTPASTPVVSLDGTYDLPISPTLSQLLSQSSSPASQNFTLPAGFGFPFYNQMEGYFNEPAHHQTAIQS
ncbi:hypothetical protein AMS68_006620 [Peltaster fructicola]|uniref:CBM21 domain-containing protein n=1 Tax=Peltaster fructicola TaxID=286661 RepID=A0A6H0Y259_9PEZI|nr:hypothetical protein AMS68_006620 [Peltaster fructicola]